MNRLKNFGMMAVGVLLGIVIAPVAARAAENFLQAYPSSQVFYMDSQRVELEAYGIGGYNYVKLRDIGQVADFNVYYDSERNAAVIEPDCSYTGVAPEAEEVVQSSVGITQANPAVFTGELTEEAFDGIRATILGEAQEPFSVKGNKVKNAVSMIGQYPKYSLTPAGGGKYLCQAKSLSVYDGPIKHTQFFVDSLASMGQRQQMEAIVWYVCDRLTYSVEYPFVDDVLTQDGEVKGCCMAYAYCVQFLCNRAGIPCVLASSDTHQWNRVYVDGQWWNVDATANDDTVNGNNRSLSTILCSEKEMQGTIYKLANPEATRFAMELLVPGSTK